MSVVEQGPLTSEQASGAFANTQPRTPGSRYLLGVLLAIYTANFIDRTLVGTLAQPIKHELHLTDGQIGLLGGLAFALLYAALGLPIARLSQRRDRITLLGLCVALWSLATGLCGVAHTFGQLLLARVGVGIGEAGCAPISQSLISDATPPHRRALGLSLFALGTPLGILLGAVLGGAIGQAYGWRSAFLMLGLPGLLLALLARLTLRDLPRGRHDPSPAPEGLAPNLLSTTLLLGRDAMLRDLVLASVCATFGAYGVQLFAIPYLMRGFHLSLLQASSGYGLIHGAAMAIGVILGGWAATRLSARSPAYLSWVPAAGMAIGAGFHALSLLQTTLPPLAITAFLASASQGVIAGPSYAALNNRLDPRARAMAVAVMMLLINLLGMGLGPLVTGLVSDGAAKAGFSGGIAAAACTGKVMSAACQLAGVAGLRLGLAFNTLPFLIAGLLFYRAGLNLGVDQNRAANL